MLTIREETPRQPEVAEMIRQADEFAAALYPPETRYPFASALAAGGRDRRPRERRGQDPA